jgi:hypothetical protein
METFLSSIKLPFVTIKVSKFLYLASPIMPVMSFLSVGSPPEIAMDFTLIMNSSSNSSIYSLVVTSLSVMLGLFNDNLARAASVFLG